MKKFLFILGIVVLAGGIFVGGMVIGTQLDFMNAMFQFSTLDKALVDASEVFQTVSYLDNGESKNARGWLNLKLDSYIITIDQFIKDCPNFETREHAERFLIRVAKHRQKYPSKVSLSKEVPDYAGVEEHIQSILENVLEQEGK
ncbi:MAG: hypothetical protein KJ887_00815 [Candidatus Omnitrophica bacterium]|nr:hypothetical protein [Candidatus Omnitrophota bacterium]MBU1047828.1 hypothetical protein [Candidatus Omnitrophota bacterium]MBU1631101.1 hypothetical protein [Candidatus Omnitrophota bacterium]MBU1766734.1 hypothetical protein [Candidatus Omnitrophota bacterium]MBU1889215.1 hypothetical protein [Candidatus Omnitrophota bacterium]